VGFLTMETTQFLPLLIGLCEGSQWPCPSTVLVWTRGHPFFPFTASSTIKYFWQFWWW
jgi:hypothetical protein